MHRRWALIVFVALTACQSSASESPASSDEAPSASAPASSAAEGATGTITLPDEGAAVDGPGLSIPEALEAAAAEPLLVNGILLQDAAGMIWLCESVSDGSPRACADSWLQVENWPDDVATFDPENAETTGLQEEDGVAWIEDYQLYGTVAPSD